MDPMTMPDVLPLPERRSIESSPEDRPIVAIRVIQLRQRRGMTIKALAKVLGVTDRTVRSIESGDKMPTIKLALKIAEALQVPPGTLFKRIGGRRIGSSEEGDDSSGGSGPAWLHGVLRRRWARMAGTEFRDHDAPRRDRSSDPQDGRS
jgi:transcriptional regulator with XRE-family HTH domain